MTGLSLSALLALFPLCASPARAAGAPGENWDARVVAVSGDVVLLEPGQAEADGVAVPNGMPLQEGDRLKTGEGWVDVSFDGTSLVRLTAQSDCKLADIDRSQTLFELSRGTFLAKIKKLLATQSLQVRAETAVAAVRGTEFGVEVPADAKQAFFGVFDEGKLEVKGSAGTEKLIGGQETAVGPDGKPASPYQLLKLAAHRNTVRGFRSRLAKISRDWRRLSPDARAALRKSLLAKAVAAQKRRQESKQKAQGERRKESDKMRKERAEMERAREKARSRARGQ